MSKKYIFKLQWLLRIKQALLEFVNKGTKLIFLLADARNVTLKKHSINGAQVEVSCHPFTEENSESQSSQVSH